MTVMSKKSPAAQGKFVDDGKGLAIQLPGGGDKEAALRVRVARLAHARPDLRQDLVPLLRKTAEGKPDKPPKWKQYLETQWQKGKKRVPNTDPKTKGKYKEVSFNTLFKKDEVFHKEVMADYKKWVAAQEKDGEGKKKRGPARLATPEERQAWGAAVIKKQKRASWSEDEKEAVNDYTGSIYERLNAALRSGEKLKKDEGGVTHHLDALFNRSGSKIAKAVYATRGVTQDHPLVQMMREGTLKKDTVVEDQGYVSTTLVPVEEWENTWKNADAELVITVPKGTKALYLGAPPEYGEDEGAVSEFPTEYELLLSRGAKMKVTGFDLRKKRINVTVEA